VHKNNEHSTPHADLFKQRFQVSLEKWRTDDDNDDDDDDTAMCVIYPTLK